MKSVTPTRLTNILLVDDDTVDVMNLKRAFSRGNISNPVYVASNGAEALDLLRSDGFPKTRVVVLLDINMPKMNGMEFLRALRADPQLASTLVVILTTSNEERDRIEAYKMNVAGYLLKPVTSASLVELATTMNKYWSLLELP
jgi:CheY-like chemotaxis protein